MTGRFDTSPTVNDCSAVAGELYDQIAARKQLPPGIARFYAAEMVLMLEYLRTEQASKYAVPTRPETRCGIGLSCKLCAWYDEQVWCGS